jgi:hypothetical protein
MHFGPFQPSLARTIMMQRLQSKRSSGQIVCMTLRVDYTIVTGLRASSRDGYQGYEPYNYDAGTDALKKCSCVVIDVVASVCDMRVDAIIEC